MVAQTKTENEIFLDRASFAYNGKQVVRSASLEVPPGDFLGIIGPNGAGKSTILRIVGSILKPSEGGVFLRGKPLSQFTPMELAREIAVLPAETFLSFDFTVREIVAMGRAPHLGFWSRTSEHDLNVVKDSMQAVGILPLAERSIHSLSSGERQMAFLAQAMAQQPKILLLDEPTVHLDIRHQLQTFQILKDWNESGELSIVVISHDINIASQFCKRLALVHEGRIIKVGNPKEVVTEQNIHDVYGIRTKVIASPETGLPAVLFK